MGAFASTALADQTDRRWMKGRLVLVNNANRGPGESASTQLAMVIYRSERNGAITLSAITPLFGRVGTPLRDRVGANEMLGLRLRNAVRSDGIRSYNDYFLRPDLSTNVSVNSAQLTPLDDRLLPDPNLKRDYTVPYVARAVRKALVNLITPSTPFGWTTGDCYKWCQGSYGWFQAMPFTDSVGHAAAPGLVLSPASAQRLNGGMIMVLKGAIDPKRFHRNYHVCIDAPLFNPAYVDPSEIRLVDPFTREKIGGYQHHARFAPTCMQAISSKLQIYFGLKPVIKEEIVRAGTAPEIFEGAPFHFRPSPYRFG